MAESKTACVVGGNGFVASLLIKQLLEKGYAVKTTVRDPGQCFIQRSFMFQFQHFVSS